MGIIGNMFSFGESYVKYMQWREESESKRNLWTYRPKDAE